MVILYVKKQLAAKERNLSQELWGGYAGKTFVFGFLQAILLNHFSRCDGRFRRRSDKPL